MLRYLSPALLLLLSLNSPGSQAFAETPAFDVASITPCAPGTQGSHDEMVGLEDFVHPGGKFIARATTLKFLIEWAYGIQPQQHSDGPDWIGSDRYDVIANAADANATPDQMKLMVRTLLSRRFRLRLREEQKEMDALEISLGKTPPKLFPPKDGEIRALQFTAGGPSEQRSFHISATRYSLQQLVNTYARVIGTVILNQTGLDGEYDFTLDLTPGDANANPMGEMLIASMREQLGLTVKTQKTAVDYYVIEGAEKVAAGN